VTMVALTVGDEYAGFRDFVADPDINPALLDAIGQAVDSIVDDTGLTWPFDTVSAITVEDETVVLHSAGEVTVELALKAGWNMVSVPVIPDDPAVSVVFAGAEVVYTWDPDGRYYVRPSQVEPERGYWVALINDGTIGVTGTPVTSWESQLYQGWNMTGSIYGGSVAADGLVDTPPDSIQRAALYHWNPIGRYYERALTIDPGMGYWVATIRDCMLSIS